MKKRYFLIPLLGILCFFLVFALASCSKDDDTDGFDYEDKQNGWWSECLILNEAPESEEQVFGTGGESGLVSEWALERNGKPSDSNQYWLVVLVYGDGDAVVGKTEGVFYDGKQVTIGGEVMAELDFLFLSDVQTRYNEECVDFGEAYVTGDFLSFETGTNGTLEETRYYSFFYSLPSTYDRNIEHLKIKGMLVVPFSIKVEDPMGRLYANLDLSVCDPEDWWTFFAEFKSNACINLIKDDDSSTKVEIGATSVRYLTASAYNNGWYAEEELTATADFGDSGICFMVFDFTARALEDNDGTKSFYVAAVAPEREKIAISIEEAPTGNIEETLYDGKTTVYGVFKLPAMAGEEKKVRMIFSLRSTSGGNEVRVDLLVSGDETIHVSGTSYIGQDVYVPETDFVYELNDDEKSYSVVKYNEGASVAVIPEVLKDGLPVTGISSYAFSGCTGLTSITIPNSITTIGRYVFEGCINLVSIIVESGNTAYYNVDGCLIEVASKTLIAGCKDCTIPDDGSVTAIGDGAFRYRRDLTSITIPHNITVIGNDAFSGCSGFESIVIPNGVTIIGNGAFSGCSALTSIAIPDGVTDIGNDVFSACSDLAVVEIPDSVTIIGNGAFKDCRSLTSMLIPDGVRSIGANAFYGCGKLASITMPDSVTAIGSHAFNGCCDLEEIIIPIGVTTIGEYAFYHCCALKSVTIPSVTTIEARTFGECKGLSMVTISDGVTAIGRGAFPNVAIFCRSLSRQAW